MKKVGRYSSRLYSTRVRTWSSFFLRQGGAGTRLHHRNVRTVDQAIGSHVFTEIAACYLLTGLRLGLGDIARVDRTIRGRVSLEHAHRNRNVSNVRPIVNVGQSDRNVSSVRYFAAIHRYHAAVNISGCRLSAARRRGDALNRTRESGHDCVISTRSAGATFDSLRSAQRKIDIERAGRAMSFTRDGADGRDACCRAEVVSTNQVGRCGKTVVGLRLHESVIDKGSRAMLDRIVCKSACID